jgi:lambda family phage tail tape measure protein
MTDALVKVGVDTTEGVQNLKKLERASKDAKDELSTFDSIINTAFGSKNVFHVTNFNRALSSLVDTMKTVSIVMVAADTAVGAFFGAIIKELNKLQGFLSIMTLTTKSVSQAQEEFEFLRMTANKLGIDLNVLTSNYAKLVAAIPEGNDQFAIAHKLFTGLAMAARTLHASTLDTQLMFYAVTQMASKGVVSMEELRRQLGERLPGALQIAAKALQTTTSELEAAIRQGIVQSAPFLKYFGDELIRTFADSANVAADTVDAAMNRLTNVWVDFVKAVLDSGAGKAIIQVFDELRNKLSDPTVMQIFAATISDIALKVAAFIKSLTAQDIINAFAALRTGIEFVVTATVELIKAMTWLINNSRTVGAVIGAMVGASKGAALGFMVGGPGGALIGAGVGAAAGAAGGYAVGSAVAPTSQDENLYFEAQAKANQQIAETQRETGVMLQSVIGSLSALGFSSTNQSDILPMIEKRMGFNVGTAGQFAGILYGNQYKNMQERQAAALTLASTGQALGPRGTLADVIGAGKGKHEKAKKEVKIHHENLLKEGEDYIKMLERQLVKEEQLTEVEKLWRALAEDRVHFNSEENFLKAKRIAQMIDEENANQALAKSNKDLTKSYQDQLDKYEDVYNKGLMTGDQAKKAQTMREFEQKVDEELAKIPSSFVEARKAATAFADVLKTELAGSIDLIIEKSRTFGYGWQSALASYVDAATNAAKQAEDIFKVSTQAMEDALVDFVKTGKFNIKSLVDTILTEMARIAARQLTANIATQGTGLLGSVFGNIFHTTASTGAWNLPGGGQVFAAGGRPQVGGVSLVGENGPELFVPDSAGTIIPNGKFGASGGTGVTIVNNNNIDSRSDLGSISTMLEMNRQATLRAVREQLARRSPNLRI